MRIEPQEHRVVLQGDVQLTRGTSWTASMPVAEYGRSSPHRGRNPADGVSPPLRKPAWRPAVHRFTVRGNVARATRLATARREQGVVDVPGQTLSDRDAGSAPPVVRDGSELLSASGSCCASTAKTWTSRPSWCKRSLAEDGQAKPRR